MADIRICPQCHGVKEIEGKPCPKCKGKGLLFMTPEQVMAWLLHEEIPEDDEVKGDGTR